MTRVPVPRPSPESYSVERYIGLLRQEAAAGDVRAHAFGLAAEVAAQAFLPAEERLRRIGNLAAAVDQLTAEQRAAFYADRGFGYSRDLTEAAVPSPAGADRGTLHVGVVENSGRLGSARLRALDTARFRELV
jgi:hypothetical protein